MVKICPTCVVAWAGGYRCEVCGGRLIHPKSEEARTLPPSLWRDIKIDYGARRGMIVRFFAIFAGALTALFGVRSSIPEPPPWSYAGAILSLGVGVVVWRLLYVAAERVVRLYVLSKGKLRRGKLVRVLLRQAVVGGRRPA